MTWFQRRKTYTFLYAQNGQLYRTQHYCTKNEALEVRRRSRRAVLIQQGKKVIK